MKDKKQELMMSIGGLISSLNYEKNNINTDKFNREQVFYANEIVKQINNTRIIISGIMNLNLTPKARKRLNDKHIMIDGNIIKDAIFICNNDFKLANSFCIIRGMIKKSGATSRPSNKKIIACILASNYDIDKSLELIFK